MFSLHDRPAVLCDGVSRREWLRVGGLSMLGLSLPGLLRAESLPPSPPAASPRLARDLHGATFGRAKNVIFLWLQGGPPQHETFDPKPDAPAEIRGPFKPIATNVPGVRFCELLPRTACFADRLAVVRSMATDDDSHDVSGYWVLTGYPYGGASGTARQIKPNDWPYFGSLVKMLRPSERLPALTSVWIPDVMRLNDNVTPAGQTAGFLGKLWEPARFIGDPAAPAYRVEGLALPDDLPRLRVDRRHDLLKQLDTHFGRVERGGPLDSWDRLAQHAYDLVTSGRARAAFDLAREPESVRDRYGRYTWGQSCLLARRLVEAGVRLVHVNWAREPGESAVDNPMWDTHAQNADRLQDALCPMFDVTFAALLDDLGQRGLLAETLVVAIGEFGRTPRINAVGGRDHWGHVFSFALAGAGIRGGQVLGSSDRNGAHPATDPVRPHDLTATIFHLLGIDPAGTFRGKNGQLHLLTKGEPLARLLGTEPATRERTRPEGDPAFVPPFDARQLLDTDFRSGRLSPPAPPSRVKGWRAWPRQDDTDGQGLVVSSVGAGSRHIVISPAAGKTVARGARALLAQEVRNARGGQYTFTARAWGGGPSAEAFARDFLAHFTCRLVIFRYADRAKDPRRVQELASAVFRPEFGDAATAKRYTVSRFLGSTQAQVNFPIGNGLGVAVVVEKSSAGALEVPRQAGPGLCVGSVSLEFSARPRDETVVD
ncbi:MAG TPA: DUF1501 domain-containing protein [Gemmataceae bacterium]|nr:DUF1501 domain-containing protein [Gemmataceae bacterium]